VGLPNLRCQFDPDIPHHYSWRTTSPPAYGGNKGVFLASNFLVMNYYKLSENGETAIPCTAMEASSELDNGMRLVARTIIAKDVIVSTTFIPITHRISTKGEPIVWETLVFGGPADGRGRRCHGTREDARRMHDGIVETLTKVGYRAML
jgi:hypothetical protein